MRIEYEIAGGHRRGDLDNFIIANPAMEESEAKRTWINARFGKWIEDTITGDFTIYEITTFGFRVEFPKDADALAFLRTLGGRPLDAQ